MKKITLLLLLIAVNFTGFAQSWDFTNGTKNGWTKVGTATTITADAGGVQLDWVPGTNAVTMKNVATGITDAGAAPVFAITAKVTGATNISKIKLVYLKDDASGNKNYKVALSSALTSSFVTYYIDLTGKDWGASIAKTELAVQFLDGDAVPNTTDQIVVEKIEFLTSIPTSLKESYTFDGDAEGFSAVNGSISGPTSGILTFTPVAAKYAKLVQLDHHVNATAHKQVHIILKNNSALNNQLRLVSAGFTGTLTKEMSVNDGSEVTYSFDLTAEAGWTGDQTFTVGIGSLVDGKAQDAGTVEFNSIIIDNVLSVDKVNFKDDANITVYPNPTSSRLNIQSPLAIEKVEVYNLLGQKAMAAKSTELNVSDLANGLYIVKIFQDNEVISTKRFIK